MHKVALVCASCVLHCFDFAAQILLPSLFSSTSFCHLALSSSSHSSCTFLCLQHFFNAQIIFFVFCIKRAKKGKSEQNFFFSYVQKLQSYIQKAAKYHASFNVCMMFFDVHGYSAVYRKRFAICTKKIADLQNWLRRFASCCTLINS